MSTSEMGGSVLTYEAIRKQYPPEKYILVLPQVARHLLDTQPMYSLDVATVKVEPENDRDAYKIAGDKYGLTKISIDKIATAADVSTKVRRVDDRSNPLLAEFESYAVMHTPSGGVRGQGRTAEWDGEAARDKVMLESKAYVEKGISNHWQGFREEDRDRLVAKRFAAEWVRERQFGKRKVETAAANRAIRALLGLSTSYSKQELATKEFAIVRFVFSPDMSDPEIKRLVVTSALQARSMLYAGSTSDVPQLAAAPRDPGEGYYTPEPIQPEEEVAAAAVEDADVDDLEIDEPWDKSRETYLPAIQDGMTKITVISEFRKVQEKLNLALSNEDGLTLQRIWEYLVAKEYIS